MNYLPYADLADCLPESTIFVDTDGIVQALNKAARREFSAESLLCRPLTDAVIDTPEKLREYLDICFRSRDFIPGTLTFTSGKRHAVYHARGAAMIPKAKDTPSSGLLVIRLERKEEQVSPFLALNLKIEELSREIRTRRLMEQALKAAEARFFALAEKTSVIPYEIDAETGRLNFVAPQFAELLLCPTARIQGEGLWQEFVHPDDARIPATKLEAIRQRGQREFEYRVISRAGKEIWLMDVCSLSRDAQGREVILGFLLNVTRRKEEEERRRQEDAKAEQFRRSEGLAALAGGIAHEFNNILVGIMGNADLALDDLPANSPIRMNLMEIGRAAQRATELTRQMAACTGRPGLSGGRPLSLPRLAEMAVDTAQGGCGDLVTFHLEVPPTIPQLHGDSAQIALLLSNLLENACEAHGDQRGRVILRLATEELDEKKIAELNYAACEPGQYIVLEIEDNGRGMDAATAGRVMDPFFSTKFPGRGLGLSAAQGIVRAHRGGIKLESTPGNGTIVRVYLPGPTEAAVETIQEGAAGQAGEERKPTVLVADDEPTVRIIAQRILQRSGYQVVMAQDGAEALELLRANSDRYAFAMLDIVMPRKNGIETYNELRTFQPRLPVLFCSAYHEHSSEVDLTRDPRVRFLRKPFNVKGFNEVVADLVRGEAIAS